MSFTEEQYWKLAELAGVWAAALGSFFAAFVALNIANRNVKPNLEVDIGVGFNSIEKDAIITYDGQSLSEEEIDIEIPKKFIIKITNVGMSNVYIDKIYFFSGFPFDQSVLFRSKKDMRKKQYPLRVESGSRMIFEYNQIDAKDTLKIIGSKRDKFLSRIFIPKVVVMTTNKSIFISAIPDFVFEAFIRIKNTGS